MTTTTTKTAHPKLRSFFLWVAAFLFMVMAASWQRTTGPTYDYESETVIDGRSVSYSLTRSAETTGDTRVALPSSLAGEGTAFLIFKRYPTDDPYARIRMETEGDEIVAHMPRQPAAGKLAYFIEITSEGTTKTLPEGEDRPVIIRYKNPVPAYLLVPHILFMFVGMMLGVRTALGALFMPETMRRWTFWTLGLISVGGLVLGPMVQNMAFGSYWTGWPFGGDLTDNKTLIMWVGWLAAAILVRRPGAQPRQRLLVVIAAIIMIGVYLVPHSLRGSELDYDAVDQGKDATEAVETGR